MSCAYAFQARILSRGQEVFSCHWEEMHPIANEFLRERAQHYGDMCLCMCKRMRACVCVCVCAFIFIHMNTCVPVSPRFYNFELHD